VTANPVIEQLTGKLCQGAVEGSVVNHHNLINQTIASVSTILLGKEAQVRLAVACLLARGHLLIEDLPGMGKTTLSHALAAAMGLAYQRIQFTSDLLPADIIGVSIFRQSDSRFEFQPGPLFAQVLLADEINRATPKTQSALLEAMEERQVTVDGFSHALPKTFFVIATQNPAEQAGTFPLPESQLDRFLMRISLGYPDPRVERELMTGQDRRLLIRDLRPVLSEQQLLDLQALVGQVHVSDAIVDYMQRLIAFTRSDKAFQTGLSPRAALALVQASRAFALVSGRQHVVPEDVQAVLGPLAVHRLQGGDQVQGQHGTSLVNRMLSAVDVIDRKLIG
jgi:MoxR-like ATPase